MSPRLTCSSIHPLRAARVPTGRPWSRKPTGSTRHQGRYGTTTQLTVPSDHCMEVCLAASASGSPAQNAPIASPSISVPGPLSPRACRRIARRLARKRLEHQTGLEDPIGHAGQSVLRAGERMATRPATGIVVHVRGCEVAARPDVRTGGIVTRAESGRATWLARGHAQYPIAPWPGLVLDHVGGRR